MFIMRRFECQIREHGSERTKPTRLSPVPSVTYELRGADRLTQVTLRVFRDVDQQSQDGGGQTFSPDESRRVQPRNVNVPQTLLSGFKPSVELFEEGGKLSSRLSLNT